MAMFNCYVSSPEGIPLGGLPDLHLIAHGFKTSMTSTAQPLEAHLGTLDHGFWGPYSIQRGKGVPIQKKKNNHESHELSVNYHWISNPMKSEFKKHELIKLIIKSCEIMLIIHHLI